MSRFHLFPASLLGRMVFVFTIAIIGVGLMASIMTWQDNSRVAERNIREQMAGKIASLITMFDTLTPLQRNDMAQRLNKKNFRIEFTHHEQDIDTPLIIKNEIVAAQYKQFVSNNLNDTRVVIVTLVNNNTLISPKNHPQKTDKNPFFSMRFAHNLPYSLHIQTPLADDTWVHFIWNAPLIAIDSLSTEFISWLFIALVVIWLVAYLVVRWITHPLNVLAQAAERLGNDIKSPPLQEKGSQEVRQAALAFNKMQQKIQLLLAERARFFAAISHDLKTPITRLRLRAELLNDPTLQQKIIHDLLEMELLLTNALDYSRGVVQEEEKTPLDIVVLLQEITKNYVELGYPVNCTNMQPNEWINGSPLALKRCFTNIIDNAVRYGKSAEIAISGNTNDVTIVITDTGPGVPQEELTRILEPFYRIEPSRNKATGGYGLGLSIANTIIQAHNGQLHLSSPENKGLCVQLILPR